jgi:uncharacterized membrane protein
VLALLGLLFASVALAAPRSASGIGAIIVAAALLIPLALPLPGILRRNRPSFARATLCVTPCLIYGVTESIANPGVRWLAATILLASLLLCAALVAYLRLTRPCGAVAQSPR